MKCQGTKADGNPCPNNAVSDSAFCRHHQDQAADVIVRVWAGAYPQHTPFGMVQRGELFTPTEEWLASLTARRMARWIMTPAQWEEQQKSEV